MNVTLNRSIVVQKDYYSDSLTLHLFFRFKSLHCHLYPNLQWCLEKKQQVAEELLHQSKNDCLCSWKKLICCKVYQDNYKKMAEARMLKQLAIS